MCDTPAEECLEHFSLFKNLAVKESNLLLRLTNSLSLQTLLTDSKLRALSNGVSVFTLIPNLSLQVSSSSISSTSSLRSSLSDLQCQMSVLVDMSPPTHPSRQVMLARLRLGERVLATVSDARFTQDIKTAALLAVKYWEP